ncbi:MAG: hypothetical protein J0L77_09410 [Alphaproteobacteria bacterium]|nr:hypothetical protein [Alphaproteobacteria bacterium]
MTVKSPNRKVFSWSGIGTKKFEISEDNFQKIEKQSKVRLLKKQKNKINRILFDRSVEIGREKNAPTRGDIFSELEIIIKSMDNIAKVFGVDTGTKVKNKKAKENLRTLIEVNKYPNLDLERMLCDLLITSAICQNIKNDFSRDDLQDHGGRNTNPMISELISIIGSDPPIKTIDKFLSELNKKIPKEYKIEIPSIDALKKIKQRQ